MYTTNHCLTFCTARGSEVVLSSPSMHEQMRDGESDLVGMGAKAPAADYSQLFNHGRIPCVEDQGTVFKQNVAVMRDTGTLHEEVAPLP